MKLGICSLIFHLALVGTCPSKSCAESLEYGRPLTFQEPDGNITAAAESECHPTCATCKFPTTYRNYCQTCADGSPLNLVGDDWGFCGERCPLCYDDLAPAEPNNTFWRGFPQSERSNCSSEYAFVPWPISADGEECPLVHKLTYLQCGCPSLPPLPPPKDTANPPKKCTLCADGSDPLYPEAKVAFRGYASTTCGLLADAFAHPILKGIPIDLGGESVDKDSLDCTLHQHDYYEECGCPAPEVHKDACTLCYDGAPVQENYTDTLVDEYSLEYRFPDSITCGELEENMPWRWYSKEDAYCKTFNEAGANYCGCALVPTPAPTPAPTLPSSSSLPTFKHNPFVLLSSAIGAAFMIICL